MQFIAHLVVDFLLQSEKWCIEKEKHVLSKQHLLHGVIVAVTAYIFSLDVYFIISALIIGFSHLAIDVLKSYCIQKREDKKASIFFIDQLLHVILLSLVSWIYLKNYTPNYLFDFHLNLNVMTVFAAFLFCAKPANIFIRHTFDLFGLTIAKQPTTGTTDNTSEKELENAGKVIGIMERFMALGLILAGQYGAVGLIIAAKSILRFNSPQKNEYILVGTLLSFGCAILIGLLINQFIVSVK
jgi:hypothetical protein